MWFRRKPKSDAADASRSLREQALTITADQLGLTRTPDGPEVWGMLMETG
jgi:hypothetical protein